MRVITIEYIVSRLFLLIYWIVELFLPPSRECSLHARTLQNRQWFEPFSYPNRIVVFMITLNIYVCRTNVNAEKQEKCSLSLCVCLSLSLLTYSAFSRTDSSYLDSSFCFRCSLDNIFVIDIHILINVNYQIGLYLVTNHVTYHGESRHFFHM